MDWTRMAQDYGLIGVVMASFITFLGFIIKWILAQFKVELEANRVERTQYLDALHKIREEITDHNIRSKEFCINVTAEHKEMISCLGRINGYKE
jgi:hypothetical protein